MRLPRALCLTTATLGWLFVATPISAQVASVPSTGITVTGRGVVRVHADVLRLLAYLGPVLQRNAMIRTGATTDGAAGVPASPPDVDAAADAIAKSLRDAGVADATSGISATFNQAIGGRVITGTVHNPTRQGIDALVRAGNAAAANYPNVTLQNLVLSFYASDCGAAEARAQDAALSDARTRAERAAHAAGVRLGSIIVVNEAAPSAFPTAPLSQGCLTRPDTQFLAQQRNDGEGITNGDIFVTALATVTFSIVR